MSSNGGSYATKDDLKALEEHLEKRFDAKIEETKASLVETMRDIETNLLRAFHRYPKVNDVRVRSLEQEIANLTTAEKVRLANLEDRVTAVELRLIDLRPR